MEFRDGRDCTLHKTCKKAGLELDLENQENLKDRGRGTGFSGGRSERSRKIKRREADLRRSSW